ncbi:TAXI family TRAP transporter solute-binding subunit [Leucobacter sp. PH1c]|uniref:TAXI family TRAP transporter solute-binding subunit n=1 Tax=Leucobacter sp. PH1c TaxID=1397278 RepID=UPI000688172A|nr:TAXI family TRAP transporter solute-binding subunit [Leucobacter sp. PH1c]
MRGRLRHARALRGALAVLAALLCASGCAGSGAGSGAESSAGSPADSGRAPQLVIAGGGVAGIYYTYGEQLAEALRRELGVDVAVAETDGSVDNLQRVAAGEALIGFSQADTAADAIAGTGSFSEPLPLRAVARVYDESVQVVVPADSEVRSIADLAGRTVSLGSATSGVQVIAGRVLEASGVAPDQVDNPALGLEASIAALRRGEIDGFFWVGGLPTPSIERLARNQPIRLLPIDAGTVSRVNARHAAVYRLTEFPIGISGAEPQTSTMTVPNFLVAAADADDELIFDATRVLFAARSTIARKVPAAELLDRREAIFTAPLELHPGAAEFYIDARR